MWTWILTVALADAPAEVVDRLPEARATLERCVERGCDPDEGAEAAWLVALGTYLETGVADGELAATVRALDGELFADLPDVVRRAATEPAGWVAPADLEFVPVPEIPIETGSSSVAIPVGFEPTDAARRYGDRTTLRDLNWGPALVDPELQERMEQATNMCTVDLEPGRFGSLVAAGPDAEVYLALPAGGARLVIWRLDREDESMVRVFQRGRYPIPDVSGAHVVVLSYGPRDPRDVSRAIDDLVGEDASYDTVQDEDLVNQLMGHPNECIPEMDESARDKVAAIAEEHAGPLFVVTSNRRSTYAWRWDPDIRFLEKVYYR